MVMTDPSEEPPLPEHVPDWLLERLDSLELSELEAVRTSIEDRIEGLRFPIDEEIEASTAGEIIDIENHGSYALVRKHPPASDGSGVNTDVTSVYHVRRERNLDRETSLHWDYLGDVETQSRTRCAACGRTLEESASVCPNCGSTETGDSETED
jgi:hypothetical protein